tara:strand:+ start:1786 stop:2559 length:774 start_codon:yes stop_codon:yes gene_type:complete
MLKSLSIISVILTAVALIPPALAQDIEAGEKTFKKCVACHAVGPDAKNKAGPILTGVVGRQAGTVEGYRYGKDLVTAGEKGLIWTQDMLASYIEDPKQFLRDYLEDSKAKAKMAFKLKGEKDRADVAAYLATQSLAGTDDPSAETETETETEEVAAIEPAMTIEEVIAAQEFTEAFLADPANFEAGKEIWFAQCTHCHGFKAYPGKAPKLKPAKYKPTFVFKRVYKGFKKMPAWNEVYSVEEIRQIVAYVKSPGFSP